jgi:hypothetical protein
MIYLITDTTQVLYLENYLPIIEVSAFISKVFTDFSSALNPDEL